LGFSRWKKFDTPLPVVRFIAFRMLKASGSLVFSFRLLPREVAGVAGGEFFLETLVGDNYWH
jgi:hypothetical protein